MKASVLFFLISFIFSINIYSQNGIYNRQVNNIEKHQASKKFSDLFEKFAAQNQIDVEKAMDILSKVPPEKTPIRYRVWIFNKTKEKLSAQDAKLYEKAVIFCKSEKLQEAHQQAIVEAKEFLATPDGNEKAKILAKEMIQNYEDSQKYLSSAIQHFQDGERHGKIAKWYKDNAQEINKTITDVFIKWIQKYSNRKFPDKVKDILTNPILCKKYFAIFDKRYNHYLKQEQTKIKNIEDVTDEKMWNCLLAVVPKILKA